MNAVGPPRNFAWIALSSDSDRSATNADGANDVFFVKGEGIVELEVLIFDRWGRLITRWTDLSQGWDGRIPGAGLAAEGVYTFAVKAKTNAGADINYGGTVTLIR